MLDTVGRLPPRQAINPPGAAGSTTVSDTIAECPPPRGTPPRPANGTGRAVRAARGPPPVADRVSRTRSGGRLRSAPLAPGTPRAKYSADRSMLKSIGPALPLNTVISPAADTGTTAKPA